MSISDSSTHCLHLALPFLPALGEAYGADGSEGEEGRQCSGTGADSGTGDGQWDSCERTGGGESTKPLETPVPDRSRDHDNALPVGGVRPLAR